MMNVTFKDIDVGGFVFGQMTATGYEKVEQVKQDDPVRGWNVGDLIIYDMGGEACFRLVPLIAGTEIRPSGKGKVKTFKMG